MPPSPQTDALLPLGQELEGVLVVSLEQAIAAPYCSLLLADAGARVIKIEHPEGDPARKYDDGAGGQSAIFAWVNRGKESLVLDIALPEDLALFLRLIAKADVFVHNLKPGALDRKGLGRAALRALNPRLINLGISGYGTTQQAAGLKAYDFLVQAEVGLCSVTGTPENPARVGISVCDISTGLTAYSAILRALIKRGQTGLGCDIDLAMFDVLADWMNMPLQTFRNKGAAPARTGLIHALIAPYGAYHCADGIVVLGIQNNREFAAFCDIVLQRPDIAQQPTFGDNFDRIANRAALEAEIVPVIKELSRKTCQERLERAGIAFSSLNDVATLSDHPFLRNTGAEIGGVTVRLADLPVTSASPRPAHVPGLGEHSQTLRTAFAPHETP